MLYFDRASDGYLQFEDDDRLLPVALDVGLPFGHIPCLFLRIRGG